VLGRALLWVNTVPLDANRCPPIPAKSQKPTAWTPLTRLTRRLDEHLLVCDECWGIVEATEEYVRAHASGSAAVA
jgi:hypothetical protein